MSAQTRAEKERIVKPYAFFGLVGITALVVITAGVAVATRPAPSVIAHDGPYAFPGLGEAIEGKLGRRRGGLPANIDNKDDRPTEPRRGIRRRPRTVRGAIAALPARRQGMELRVNVIRADFQRSDGNLAAAQGAQQRKGYDRLAAPRRRRGDNKTPTHGSNQFRVSR